MDLVISRILIGQPFKSDSFARIDKTGAACDYEPYTRVHPAMSTAPGLKEEMIAILAGLRRVASGAPSLESLQQSIVKEIAEHLYYYKLDRLLYARSR
jgi:hypothetical protein